MKYNVYTSVFAVFTEIYCKQADCPPGLVTHIILVAVTTAVNHLGSRPTGSWLYCYCNV